MSWTDVEMGPYAESLKNGRGMNLVRVDMES